MGHKIFFVWYIDKKLCYDLRFNKKSNVSPKNADDLWCIIKKEWDSIPNETMAGLYRSIPKRLRVTLTNKSLHSHY